jgi:DNA-binding NarL/FixJ family response regulator
MSGRPVEAGSRFRNGQVIMNLLTRIFRFFRFPKETLSIPGELTGKVHAMAAQDGVTPDELVARMVRDTIEERQAAESLPGRWARLTPRQQEIAVLTGKNLTNAQIAARLGISEATVKTHQTHIMERLNLRSRYRLRQALEEFDFNAQGREG